MKLRPQRSEQQTKPQAEERATKRSAEQPTEAQPESDAGALERPSLESARSPRRQEAPELPAERPTRVVIEPVSPVVDGGAFVAKAAQGLVTSIRADVFTDGHDVVVASVELWPPDDDGHAPAAPLRLPMTPLGNDRFTASFVPDRLGRWTYDVIGWVSHAETWRRGTVLKAHAGVDTSVEAEIGRRLVDSMLDRPHQASLPEDLQRLTSLRARLADGDVSTLDDPLLADSFARTESRDPLARLAAPLSIDVDPKLASVGSWYSFFPRSPAIDSSNSDTSDRSGEPRPAATLADAVDRLDYIAALGFDVVYIPPVHPIGTTNRKGRNNATIAEPDDVGSPYAIGSADGGHRSVDPQLGTVDDVATLATECRARGMDLALDIAFNCSPDHPWVREHPDWFTTRPDGSIQFAENPPKKYEDIYPLDFETDDWRALWRELADVFRFWIDAGVRIFRVDNPHTKALPFWEWAIATIRRDHPDVIFLSEAFTRPRVLQRLAKLGFNQSYTYFAWRNSATELAEYFDELATDTIDYLRPNVWPNTHDILTEHLQHGGRAAFVSRAILAATLSPSWGIYGPTFELMETEPRFGVEDYLDSEKYQIRHWDLDRPDSLAPLIARLNEIRRDHPAVCDLASIHFHQTDHEQLLCYSKTDPSGRGDPVIAVVNVDPHAPANGFVDIDLAAIGLPYGSDYEVIDRLGGAVYHWSGNRNYVELSPHGAMAHVFTVRTAADPRTEAFEGATV